MRPYPWVTDPCDVQEVLDMLSAAIGCGADLPADDPRCGAAPTFDP
jgi:hypothetical protein